MVSHPNKPNFHEMKIVQGLTGPNSLSAPNIMILSQELASKNQNEVTVKQLNDEVKRIVSLTEAQKNCTGQVQQDTFLESFRTLLAIDLGLQNAVYLDCNISRNPSHLASYFPWSAEAL